jgi:hypothetical protein
MEEICMLTRTNGIIGVVVGLILALVGVVTFVAMSHHKIGAGLLVVGLIVLAVGIYAYVAGPKGRTA